MKAILYMAMTANGYIATTNDDTPWSFEEWKSWTDVVERAGNLIIGRKTYDLMRAHGEFARIPNAQIVVLSSRVTKEEGNATFVDAPGKALDLVRQKGFKEAVIAGGATCNASFMKLGLVDEAYVDIEPLFFGTGIPLFAPQEFRDGLKLLEHRHLNDNTIQLHYAVDTKARA